MQHIWVRKLQNMWWNVVDVIISVHPLAQSMGADRNGGCGSLYLDTHPSRWRDIIGVWDFELLTLCH